MQSAHWGFPKHCPRENRVLLLAGKFKVVGLNLTQKVRIIRKIKARRFASRRVALPRRKHLSCLHLRGDKPGEGRSPRAPPQGHPGCVSLETQARSRASRADRRERPRCTYEVRVKQSVQSAGASLPQTAAEAPPQRAARRGRLPPPTGPRSLSAAHPSRSSPAPRVSQTRPEAAPHPP